MVTGVGGWSPHGTNAPVGTRVPLDDTTVTGLVHESGRPARLDGYGQGSGEVAEIIEALGVRSSVGAPITVDGRPWGVMIASSNRPEPLAADTEARIAAFTDLVATAISNTESRTETRRLAEEQAALRRVATLVAEAVPPSDLFDGVAAEVGTLLGAELATLFRYEDEDTVRMLSIWTADDVAPGDAGDLEGGGARPIQVDRRGQLARSRRRLDAILRSAGSIRAGRRRGDLIRELPDPGRGATLGRAGRPLDTGRAAPAGHRGSGRRVHRADRDGDLERPGPRGSGRVSRSHRGCRGRRAPAGGSRSS